MIKKSFALILFYVGLADLPIRFAQFFDFFKILLSYDSIRTLICLLAFLLFSGDYLVKFFPFLQRLDSRLTIYFWGLKPIREIAKKKEFQTEPNKIHSKDSIRGTINSEWAAIKILSVVRAGLLPAWLYNPESGRLETVTPQFIEELFRSGNLRNGEIPNLLVSESKIKKTIEKFQKLGELAK